MTDPDTIKLKVMISGNLYDDNVVRDATMAYQRGYACMCRESRRRPEWRLVGGGGVSQ